MRATLESSSKIGSFDRISSHLEFWNFENRKDLLCCFWAERERNHLSTTFEKFEKLWVVGVQGSTYWIFCCSSFTIVFHDIGFINHHYFVFGSSEVLLFKLWTKLCSNHKGDSNNTILLKTLMKTHISRTINLTFNAKQPGDMR